MLVWRALRAVVAIGVYNVFRGFVVGGYMTLFSMYMRSLGYSMESIGGVIAVSSIISAIVLPAIGVYIDRMGPRIWVIITGFMQFAGIALLVFTDSLEGLAASYFLFLLSFMAGQPSRMSYLARSVELASLGTLVGLTSSIFSASRLVGPAAGGFIAGELGFKFSFEILAIASLVGLAFFTVLSTNTRLKDVSAPNSVKEAYRSVIRPPKNMSSLLLFIGADRFSWGLWFQLLSAHLYGYGYTEFEVGTLITLSGVVQTAFLPIAGKLVDKLGATTALALSELVGAASALILAQPQGLNAYLAMALLGLSIASWVPSYNTLIAKVAGEGGSGYTAANTSRSIAGAPAPYLGGFLYDYLTPAAPFGLSALSLAILGIIAKLYLRKIEDSASVSKERQARSETAAIPLPPAKR
ncbi:MAG: MFS transporter [Aeropyrum sp.]|nr:MFS transporter [Aeropyrum sp.]